MKMELSRIATVLNAVGEQTDGRTVTRVQIDSRVVQPGDLFVCLPGERVDGHSFAADAVRKGAVAVLAQRPLPEVDGAPVLLVRDTCKALGDLAVAWRGSVQSRVVAVTGSAGKTTVKELIAQTLAAEMSVAKNHKNLNNQIGLPLSMLAASGEEDVWVMEVGISRQGDMEELAPIASPDLAVIHNIGPAHLEGLGSLRGVAEAKAHLLTSVRSGGAAIVNRDYPELWEAAQRIFPGVRAMSTQNEKAPYFCTYLGPSRQGGVFLLRLEDERLEVDLPFLGSHFAENVVAAASAAYRLGMSAGSIVQALAKAQLPDQRFAAHQLGFGTLIDDTYNANPLSMSRAIQAATELAGNRPLVLVLGDMLELGSEAEVEHVRLGERAAASGCAAVVYRGGFAKAVARGLAQAGFKGRFQEVRAGAELPPVLEDLGLTKEQAGTVILAKGSRSSRMEEFVTALRSSYGSNGGAGQ
ncbi:UDP-N-acetylmuramoyl-tripeptide--D-alanyl-D-alanine ligase [Desulfocurvibacter africanus PCS]|uniref:UDP-N-acetylmuramoyl-tripeptide--D-alanyl-D-alanine ligase n=1 Tax=Desulfocurvibacter africanus PCS TaxID=1262666 RepID=M5PRF6_DESAF|nr:UDP-N-acetylmuramoyl-tripeptide--D-alanyl-D-alanine ligase [Desulfocurvibacter africanus]EMG36650.1 UDP-N-acetylmuramoyl-tripeptide--D-alanyl-D-alanine ligase [Desulfocurvibacter africanus PCS]